jgi:hypothetical protein
VVVSDAVNVLQNECTRGLAGAAGGAAGISSPLEAFSCSGREPGTRRAAGYPTLPASSPGPCSTDVAGGAASVLSQAQNRMLDDDWRSYETVRAWPHACCREPVCGWKSPVASIGSKNRPTSFIRRGPRPIIGPGTFANSFFLFHVTNSRISHSPQEKRKTTNTSSPSPGHLILLAASQPPTMGSGEDTGSGGGARGRCRRPAALRRQGRWLTSIPLETSPFRCGRASRG